MLNGKDDQGTAEMDEVSRRFGNNRPFSQQNRRGGNRNNSQRREKPPNRSENSPPCKFCVRIHQWGRKFCPAWGNKCGACGLENHFKESQICKKKRNIRNLNMDSSDNEDEEVEYLARQNQRVMTMKMKTSSIHALKSYQTAVKKKLKRKLQNNQEKRKRTA